MNIERASILFSLSSFLIFICHMKLRLGKTASNIFVVLYLVITLFFRFILEGQLNGHFLASFALGAFALLFLWALWKSGYIQPTLFGLNQSNK